MEDDLKEDPADFAVWELEVKGNVSLVYEKNDVDLTRKVTVKVDNQPISKALDQILKGQEYVSRGGLIAWLNSSMTTAFNIAAMTLPLYAPI